MKREYVPRPLEFTLTLEEAVLLKAMLSNSITGEEEEEEEPVPKMSRATIAKRAAASKPVDTGFVKEPSPPPRKKRAAAKKGK
jgi:hypothetical protein